MKVMPDQGSRQEKPGDLQRASTTDGLPVAPSMEPALDSLRIPRETALADDRLLWICLLAAALGLGAGYVAHWLVHLIDLFTNIAFYGTLSLAPASPRGHSLGPWVVLVPVAGGLVVGLMARYGSKAIQGHGIPEAMEQVLVNQSRIPPRVLLLKPLSAAVSIGTGGPFGAEGPIIATGGALGSLVGQVVRITAGERKTLLAAGAAAGMTAIFGTPVSAVLLAVELLLFELRPRSVIPVSLAAVCAMGVRLATLGAEPAFPMPAVQPPGAQALAAYILIGGLVGLASVWITRLVYAIEDGFERLPLHWMLRPALGAVAVGVIGWWEPRTLGVGYENIVAILSEPSVGWGLLLFAVLKLCSWSISLGSGTSGGTLAPLFTVGGALGALAGGLAAAALPGAGVDPRIAGLVGMAAIFAGASRAFLASVVFAFEATRQPLGLLPLLGGGALAYLVSCRLMRNSIMTEKISRRGVKVPAQYAADLLDHLLVKSVATREVLTLPAGLPVEEARRRLSRGSARHQGFPLLDDRGRLVGLVTWRDMAAAGDPGTKVLELARRSLAVVYEDCTLGQARDHMIHEGVGRLPVVSRQDRHRLVGILTRSDLLRAHQRALDEERVAPRP